ncbi:polysaccharide pyruvyl transferase family protein [Alteromonas halophila]|uniref:Polysaccharide pyruvyl transferase n=1 Tax=Alteromonas halophila TaxID=516698 RepID=A0A918MXQ4_9ALTE|nr:polysaccharide pyruvyl transferase family protein [Alteromonas halophila]GGW82362.1 polysaccharide pyruvyl transferase [Alteromonas halophila]
MKKYYLDLEQIDSIPNPYYSSSEDIMRITGLNTGNFAFRKALRELVADIEDYTVVNWPMMREVLKADKKVDHVILSCANWLGFREQDEASNGVRASIIEKIDAPVTAYGLGAQASHVDPDLKLGPNGAKLARVISERSKYISVRDSFTKSLLEKEGITNALVTGCPSNFINHSDNFGDLLRDRVNRSKESIRRFHSLKTCIGEFSGGHAHSGSALTSFLTILRELPSHYIIQSPTLYPFFLGESDDIPGAYKSNMPEGMTQPQLRHLLKQKMIGFTSVDSWMDIARTCDLSLGMRIHGNMLPLQAGVPSMLIAHDSRTQGLADVMKFPVYTMDRLVGYKGTVQDLMLDMLIEFEFQLDAYLDKREELRNLFEIL